MKNAQSEFIWVVDVSRDVLSFHGERGGEGLKDLLTLYTPVMKSYLSYICY